MRIRGLERTTKPQRAAGRPEWCAPAGAQSRLPGGGGDAESTAPDQHGAGSDSQAERALNAPASAAPGFRYLGPPSLPTTRSLKGPRREPGQKLLGTPSPCDDLEQKRRCELCSPLFRICLSSSQPRSLNPRNIKLHGILQVGPRERQIFSC